MRAPSAVPGVLKRLMRATRIWIPAACRSGSFAAMRSPKAFRQRIRYPATVCPQTVRVRLDPAPGVVSGPALPERPAIVPSGAEGSRLRILSRIGSTRFAPSRGRCRSPLVERIFDIAERQREPNVHHHGTADDLGAGFEIADPGASWHPAIPFGHPVRLSQLSSDKARRAENAHGRFGQDSFAARSALI